jgi:hypothetical protein
MGFPAMNKLIAITALFVSSAFAGYTVAPTGAPPAEASAYAASVSEKGIRILKDGGSVLMELWFVTTLPGGGEVEDNTAFPNIPNGALLGIAHFPEKHNDRRGQTIKPGVYTLRYSRYPVNGDHMGVSPQRDFAVLSLAGKDPDPAAQPNFAKLMSMSRVASGTPHPLVLSIWQEDKAPESAIEEFAENETIFHTRIGQTQFAIIFAGVHEG